MANSDTVHRINAHQRTPVVLMRHLSGHHCLIAHYVWAGTDIHNLNPERKAWFVGVGREVGVHLDESRARNSVKKLPEFLVMQDTLSMCQALCAEMCGGACGGAPDPPSRPNSPVVVASGDSGAEAPPPSSPIQHGVADDEFENISNGGTTCSDEYKLGNYLEGVSRTWCYSVGHLYSSSESGVFFTSTSGAKANCPQLKIAESLEDAITGAFGSAIYNSDEYLLEVTVRTRAKFIKTFRIYTYSQCKYIVLHLSPEYMSDVALVSEPNVPLDNAAEAL